MRCREYLKRVSAAVIPFLKNKSRAEMIGILFMIAVSIIMGLGFPCKAFAANDTTVAVVSARAADATSIVVMMPYTGDSNGNNTYTVDYRLCGAGGWTNKVTNAAHTASPYTTTITGLTANACYEIRAAYNDADGVTGTNPQTIKISASWDTTLLHNSNRFSSTKWGGSWGLPGSKYGQIVCGTCHDPRASNIKGVKGSVTAPNSPTDNFPGSTANFQSMGSTNGFGDDSDNHTTSTRICQVCHSQTNHHRYNASTQTDGQAHQNNTDCMNCHPHAAGFYYATSTCSSCHGNPPTAASLGGPNGLASPATGATNPLSAGAHGAHVTTRSMTCDVCHKGTAMPAAEKKIDMGFSINGTTFSGFAGSVSTGTFTGTNALTNGYAWNASNAGTTVNTAGNYNNQCSSIYCHGSTLTGGSKTNPSWVGGSGEASCGTCHGGTAYNAPSANPPTAGSHVMHTSNAAGKLGLPCSACHNTTTDMGHVNGDVAWKLDYTDARINGGTYKNARNGSTGGLAPSGSYGNCGSLYCHSTVQPNGGGAGAPTYATPQWGNAASINCGSCHVDMSSSGSATGSHIKHAQTHSYSCDRCHTGAGANTSKHGDRNIDVIFDALNPSGSYSQMPVNPPGNGYGTCSSTYCHGSGTPAWGGASLACDQCHKASSILQGKHGVHYATATVATSRNSANNSDSTTYIYNCGVCHDPGSTTHAGGAVSVNQAAQVAFESTIAGGGTYAAGGSIAGTDNGFNWTAGSCTNTYCHSQGDKNSAYNAPNTVPNWNTSLDATCSGCHKGDATATNGTMATGSHTKHVSGSGLACSRCHSSTTTASRAIANEANHVNRLVNLAFDAFANPNGNATYNGSSASLPAGMTKTPGTAYGNCSNVYCHGSGTQTWGGASLACDKCHKASNALAGRHGTHYATATVATDRTAANNSTAGAYVFKCGVCHDPSGTTHVGGPVSSNQAGQVAFDAVYATNGGGGVYSAGGSNLGPDSGFNWTGGTCSNIYCHSPGTKLSGTPDAPNTTSFNWNSSAGTLACNGCHGNTTYSDYRKASPLYANGSPKRNAHYYHTSQQATPSNEIQCINCHGATVGSDNASIADKSKHANKNYEMVGGGTYWDFGSVGEDSYATVAAVTIGSYDSVTGKCQNVSCHPAAPAAQKSWDSSTYLCVDCHIISLQDPSMYHHAMYDSNTGPGYPTDSPDGDATTGNFPQNRKCLMCHVDHDIFSPLLNPASPGRSYTLRTSIFTTPVKNDTSTFTNKDYDSTNGGICVSCHQQERIKDQSITRSESNNTRTPVITNADFAVSKHQYQVSSYYTNTGAEFKANCTKCHDTQEKELNTFQGNYVANTNRFGVHRGPIRMLQANLGISAPAETEEEDLCYRCHSKSTDASPGGGPAKGLANKDYYGVATMSNAAEDIYTVMQTTGIAAGPSSKTNRLYFRPTASGQNPSEPMPNAHQTGDTFAGGTWIGRSMNPWTNATAYETVTIAVGSGTNVYRGITFVSPDVLTPVTVPSGTWTISINCRESSSSANSYVRYMIYKWNANDSLGTTIIAAGNYALEMSTTAAPGSARSISVIGNSVSFAAGDKIAVDIEVRTASSFGSYNVYYYFGNNAESSLALPSFVEFNYANPGRVGYGHNVQLYDGLHKASNYDEDLTYISNNKHVECTDCHNMHADGSEKHADSGTATSGTTTVLTDTTKAWTTNQWAGAILAIVGGTDSGQAKTISSNTATTITVSSAFSSALNNTSKYQIVSGTNNASNVLHGVPGAVMNTSSTSTLFLRNTTPTGTKPSSSQSGDTFQGGTWQIRDMTAVQGSAAQSQVISISNSSNPGYWRGTSFISPPLSSGSSMPAGTWTLRLWAQENSTNANAYMRASIYVWTAGGAKGTVILAPTSYSAELTTTNTAYNWTVSGASATLNAGDRIVVELEIDSRAASGFSNNATYRWNGSGTTNDAKITMPAAISVGAGYSNWTAPTYTLGEADHEYEICFKCHSGANANVLGWNHTDATTLYLGTGTPSSPPGAHQSTDTFTSGTFGTDLLVTSSATAGSQNILVNNSGANIYYRGTAFLSDTIAMDSTIPAGTWTLNIWARENNAGSNAWLRAYLYVWKANSTKVQIATPTTEGRELTLTTKTLETWTLNQASPVSVSAGDRIAVEVYIHSKAATSTTSSADIYWGGADNSSVTMPGSLPFSITGPTAWTDLGLEFNPGNMSGHPVTASLNNYTNSSAPKALNSATMNNGWTNVGTQTMYCNDCHDTDSTVSRGPHGSSVKWMLAGVNKAWPFTTTAGNGTSSGTAWTLSNYNTGAAPDTLFCLNCHVVTNTNWAHQNVMSRHSSTTIIACASCHIRIPHGGKVSRLLRPATAATLGRYAPNGNGGEVSGQTQQTFSMIKKANPYTNNPGFTSGGCVQHSTSGGETW